MGGGNFSSVLVEFARIDIKLLLMDIVKMIGTDKVNIISDDLFNNSNIRKIHITFQTKEFPHNTPGTWGFIEFNKDDTEGKRNFKGKTILDVLKQMMEFCKTIK